MSRINHALPEPVTGWVDLLVLQPAASRRWHPARAVGFSTYPGEALALSVLLEGDGPEQGALYAYLPLDAFSTQPEDILLPYPQVIWADCPAGPVDVARLDTLPGQVHVLLRGVDGRPAGWETGRYLLTLDWFEDNEMMHLCLLDRGQFALAPNHKVKFGSSAPRQMPCLSKLRGTWKVSGDRSGFQGGGQ